MATKPSAIGFASRSLGVMGLLVSMGCSDSPGTAPAETPPPGQLVKSNKPRLTAPVPAEDTIKLTSDNADFGLDVLRKAASNDNFFASPHSLSIALGMTYAGARERTATQMASALHFTLPSDRLHAAFGALDLALAQRSKKGVESGKPFELRVVNSLWGQRNYAFLPPFLDLLAERYGAGLSLLDFAGDTEGSRKAINTWVSGQTNARIPELLPVGIVSPATVLVLTNAIYFSASWLEPFETAKTSEGTFAKLDGPATGVRFMHQEKEHLYAEGDGFQAVELLYSGQEVSMLVVLPAAGKFADVRTSLNGAKLGAIVAGLGTRRVDLALPKFQFRTALGVKPTLQALGMTDAFNGGVADLSGMDGTRELFIQDVVHQAFVAVDENGTEAAAATAVVVGRTSAPQPATFTADRPFLVFIRDIPTGAVLFMGQVMSP